MILPANVKLGGGRLELSLDLPFEAPELADACEVESYADACLMRRLGTVTIICSPYTINGLAAMTRVFARVRAVRGGQSGPWSPVVSRIVSG